MYSPHSFLNHHSFLPTVYVHPPAEDSLPSFCCFDAADAVLDDEPRQILISRRESIDEVVPEIDQSDITIRGEELAADLSEVIEVIKVSRKPSAPAQPMKRSDTFITRAFRSIKNVNRSVTSRSRKESPTEITLSSESSETSRSHRFSRRSSVSLAQLFIRPSSPSQPPSRYSVDTASPAASLQRRPSVDSESRPVSPVEPQEDDADSIHPRLVTRSPSPTPSTRTFSVRKRFSVLNLFSRNASSPTLHSTTIPKMTSIESLGPSSRCSSTSSSTEPVTPVELGSSFDHVASFNPAIPFEHPAFSSPLQQPSSLKGPVLLKRLPSFVKGSKAERKRAQTCHETQVTSVPTDDPAQSGDISFEMKLDSLHFDGFNFDVDGF